MDTFSWLCADFSLYGEIGEKALDIYTITHYIVSNYREKGGTIMRTIQELESEVWRKIELATRNRNSEELAHFNALASRIGRIKELIESIEQDLLSEKVIEQIPSTVMENEDYSVHQLPPNGTVCRFSYKGTTYEGAIKNGKLEIPTHGTFKSFSGASVKITKTNRNGWNDWELKILGSSSWIMASTWRKIGKR